MTAAGVVVALEPVPVVTAADDVDAVPDAAADHDGRSALLDLVGAQRCPGSRSPWARLVER